MKLLKKTAALLFCLTLALSVMAVTAWADDDEDTAELLDVNGSGVTVFTNTDFKVMLTKSASSSDIRSRDSVPGYEISYDDQVTFDITVSYDYTAGTNHFNFANHTIDGFQFDFVPANNYGATITEAKVYKADGSKLGDILHGENATYFSENDANTYAYSSVGDKNADMPLPDAGPLTFTANAANNTESVENGTKIGSITVAFRNAQQAINIYPQIENLMFLVREGGTDSPQKLTAATIADYGTYNNSNPATTAGTITGGKPSSNGGGTSYSTPSGSSANTVIKAPIPVIVNPIYTVKLEQFENDETSGIIVKKMTTGDTPVPVTTDIKYDFLTGSFKDSSNNYKQGTLSTVLSNASLPGYTLQGWMVTKDTNDSPNWAEYVGAGFNPNWDTTTSYPATTTAMSEGILQWGTSDDTWYSAASGTPNGKVELATTNNESVNFIPATRTIDGEASQITLFPVGLIGDITLTPVYTRNVYTATFNSGDDDATFDSALNAERVSGDNSPWKHTKLYTIEDLYASGAAADFLSLNDTASDWKGPQGLERTAYKFMGWTPTVTSGATETPTSAYAWNRDTDNAELKAVSAYNSTKILKTANAKHYGDVTFTAVWEEDIYYAEIGYQYAGNTHAMILVAVPSGEGANYNADYTYRFAASGAKDMFIVPTEGTNSASTQRALYVAEGQKANTEAHITEAFPATMPNEYVLFAYIAEANAANPEAKITIYENEDNKGRTNVTLNYDGDVDSSGVINVGDFGNVDTLFNNNIDNETSNVFNVTGTNGNYGVKARLQADVKTDADEGGRKFASISDIKAIYDQMGYNSLDT